MEFTGRSRGSKAGPASGDQSLPSIQSTGEGLVGTALDAEQQPTKPTPARDQDSQQPGEEGTRPYGDASAEPTAGAALVRARSLPAEARDKETAPSDVILGVPAEATAKDRKWEAGEQRVSEKLLAPGGCQDPAQRLRINGRAPQG